MRVVFIGPPGSGKGTQAKLLQERLGFEYIGTGDILRAAVIQQTDTGKQAAPYLAQGSLVPDQLVNEIVAERFHRGPPCPRFVMDGYPRTVAQAIAFDKILAGVKLPLDAVIHFVIDENEVVKRLSGRGRSDDDANTVRARLRIFEDTIRDLLDHYRRQGLLHDLHAVDTVDSLYAKITALLPKTSSV